MDIKIQNLLSASLSTKMCKGALWRWASEQVYENVKFNAILKMLSENGPAALVCQSVNQNV